MGVAIPVANKNAVFGSADSYFAIKLEWENGSEDSEYWVLLTQHELYKYDQYSCGAWASELKQGRLYEFTKDENVTTQYILKIERQLEGSETYEEVILLVSFGWLQKGIARAEKNPEDIPSEGWWGDLTD